MTAAHQPEAAPFRQPFADASPAEVRAALVPEEAAEFDRQWTDVMARATRNLDLTEVLATLESWRRVAWVTTVHSPEQHRRMLAAAEERLRTGDRHPGAVRWEQLAGELGLPE